MHNDEDDICPCEMCSPVRPLNIATGRAAIEDMATCITSPLTGTPLKLVGPRGLILVRDCDGDETSGPTTR